jgi:hypothetical protein
MPYYQHHESGFCLLDSLVALQSKIYQFNSILLCFVVKYSQFNDVIAQAIARKYPKNSELQKSGFWIWFLNQSAFSFLFCFLVSVKWIII